MRKLRLIQVHPVILLLITINSMMIKINIHKTKILKFLLIEYKKELFFKNQERFVSFYDKLNNANCSEIINNYFTNIDMSKNKNQCLMFIGNMIQRLDEKSFFGKITQKGLVNDMTKKNFYVESFDGDWLENEYKIGVIKGNEFFNYESKIGKQVIPKGTVIILDALDTLDKW